MAAETPRLGDEAETTARAPFVLRLAAFQRYLSVDFLGGPRPLRLATVINFQKGGTAFFVAGLMWLYGYNHAEASYRFCRRQNSSQRRTVESPR